MLVTAFPLRALDATSNLSGNLLVGICHPDTHLRIAFEWTIPVYGLHGLDNLADRTMVLVPSSYVSARATRPYFILTYAVCVCS